ncbi:MAG: hypothetical protein ACRD1Y_12495, partial [Terriglobales bacterium]
MAIAGAAQTPPPRAHHGSQLRTAAGPLAQVFATGWMLRDTNHDGLADTIDGHIVVPAAPSEAENAAAANFAARLAHGTTGLTPPLVVAAGSPEAASGPHIYIGAAAVPAAARAAHGWTFRLEPKHGRVALLQPGTSDRDLLVVGDAAGMTAAADAFTAHAPFLWAVGAKEERLGAIAVEVNRAAPAAHVQLVGLAYAAGTPGIYKAYLTASGPITAAQLSQAFAGDHLAAVHELFVLGGQAITAINPKPFHPHVAPAPTPAAGAAAAAAPAPPAPGRGGFGGFGAGAAPAGGMKGLDLAKVYTDTGLFGKSGPVPVPAVLKAHLYVPAGVAGIAMANVAARMGLES